MMFENFKRPGSSLFSAKHDGGFHNNTLGIRNWYNKLETVKNPKDRKNK